MVSDKVMADVLMVEKITLISTTMEIGTVI